MNGYKGGIKIEANNHTLELDRPRSGPGRIELNDILNRKIVWVNIKNLINARRI